MAEHVPGIWEAEAAAYDAGRMGSRRLMEIEMALVDVPSADLLATAAAQPHDPGFVPFVRRAPGGRDPRRGRVRRVRLLHRAGARGAGSGGVAGHLGRTTFDGLRASSPFRTATRRASCAGRASAIASWLHQAAGRLVVFIGDGESDRYAAGYADVVWAKRSLVRICIEAGWPFTRWTEFHEIEAWLGERSSAGAPIRRRWRRRSTPVLLRPRGLGRGTGRSAARRLATRAIADGR